MDTRHGMVLHILVRYFDIQSSSFYKNDDCSLRGTFFER